MLTKDLQKIGNVIDISKLKLYPSRTQTLQIDHESSQGKLSDFINSLSFQQPQIPKPRILSDIIDSIPNIPAPPEQDQDVKQQDDEQFFFSKKPRKLTVILQQAKKNKLEVNKSFTRKITSLSYPKLSNAHSDNNQQPMNHQTKVPQKYLNCPQPLVSPFAQTNNLNSLNQDQISQIMNQSSPFIDKDFPPNTQTSILDQDRQSSPQLSKLIWKRARDVYGQDFTIFPSQIHPNDIQQGSLGDCYFLSALSALAEWPQRIKALFVTKQPNEAGIYTIRLYLNGQLTNVTVDQYFPVSEISQDFAFCQSHDRKCIWPLLLQKAFAKAHGSYHRIESGTMMESLLTLTCSYIEIYDHEKYDPAHLWNSISEADKQEYIMMTNVHSDNQIEQRKYEEMGLVDHHAYTLIWAQQIQVGYKSEKLLKIRNPWGHFQWKGDWSDNSCKWTPQLKKKLDYRDQDDGIFFINFQDFTKFFSRTTIALYNQRLGYACKRMQMKRGDYRLFYLRIGKNPIPLPQSNSDEAQDEDSLHGTVTQLLLYQESKRQKTGAKNQYFRYDLSNLAIVKVSSQSHKNLPNYQWIPNNTYQRFIHCTGINLYLEPGHYLIFAQVQKDLSHSQQMENVKMALAIRPQIYFLVQKFHAIENFIEPQFPFKMMQACCLASCNPHIYPQNSDIRRYFSLSESNTSFSGIYYNNLSLGRGFQERLKFTLLDGLSLFPEMQQMHNEIEVSIAPFDHSVCVMQRTGAQSTRVKYTFTSVHEKMFYDLLDEVRDKGKSKQLLDSQNKVLNIWIKSYFEMSEGTLMIQNNELKSDLKIVFDFSRCQKVGFIKRFRTNGMLEKQYSGNEINKIELLVNAKNSILLTIEAENVWQGMAVSYGYSYGILRK